MKRHILSVPFGNILLEDLKPAAFRVYWQQMSDKGLSPRTISYVHTLTSAALKQAVADGVIPSNPLDYVRRPKKEPTKAKALNESQIKLFLSMYIMTSLKEYAASLLQQECAGGKY